MRRLSRIPKSKWLGAVVEVERKTSAVGGNDYWRGVVIQLSDPKSKAKKPAVLVKPIAECTIAPPAWRKAEKLMVPNG